MNHDRNMTDRQSDATRVGLRRRSARQRNVRCLHRRHTITGAKRMRDNESKVGRADHNPEGAQRAAEGERVNVDGSSAIDSADRHGHGAHGKGRGDEKVLDDAPVEPGHSDDSDRGGSAGWGSEGSGGSVIDKR
jgi:hypothetical protein